MFVNEQIDLEDKVAGMCAECQNEVLNEVHCSRCGKLIDTKGESGDNNDAGIDYEFDMERYEAMKNGTYQMPMDDVWDDEDDEEDVQTSPLFIETETEDDDESNDLENEEEATEAFRDIYEMIEEIDKHESERLGE